MSPTSTGLILKQKTTNKSDTDLLTSGSATHRRPSARLTTEQCLMGLGMAIIPLFHSNNKNHPLTGNTYIGTVGL